MAVKKPPQKTKKKFFTIDEANASLPLVRAIVKDIAALARDLQDRQERLARVSPLGDRGALGQAYQEEMQQVQADFERDQERMQEYEEELKKLGVQLKDYFKGLIDFPCRMNNRDVLLCWRLGEPEVAYWHDLDTGFAGRQRIKGEVGNN